MTSSQELINTLIIKIKNLPENRIKQVMDFVNYLHFTEIDLYSISENKDEIKSYSEKSSLRKFVGGVTNGSLVNDIDRELYGR